MNAASLIQLQQTWQHFIGGYYADTDHFVREAQRIGISRRAPAHAVRGMNWGDQLILLRYVQRDVFAFAEAVILGMTLEHEIAASVGQALKDRGQAHYDDTARTIDRECGSYEICGSWIVTCSWSEVMDLALEIAKQKGETLFVMVNAGLRQVYDKPVYLQPAPKFTRGFTRVAAGTSYLPWDADPQDGLVIGIKDYRRAPRLPGRAASAAPA